MTIDDYPFELDGFQRQAVAAVDAGRSVVVAAPTGSGKTVVAEHAVRLALEQGRKLFYTTPVKALSNQKYHDLVAEHGRDRVGLLTGDNAIAAFAPIVVMTTEVLRNMLYGGSPLLEGLGWVVLDEVHFLQDPYRGPVWEEVVIHLPRTVSLVCLSATISNADELAGWIRTVRGDTDLVTEQRRPVPLHHTYVVGERGSPRIHVIPLLRGGRANSEGERFDVGQHRDRRRGWVTPRRGEIVGELRRRRLLPAIYFIFSRAACDDAARALTATAVELTERWERERIDEILDAHLGALGPDELTALDAIAWRRGVRAGIAAHHAGMVPPFKEAVEACFVEGLVKVVFATETLALGINMPARSVVIERLTKFTGDGHAVLTPGQYTQLTGRAGRRGIDDEGEAWVLWSPWVRFAEVAELAASRTFELQSSFRPTYNMAANLVRTHDRDEALRLLRLSFGQYQASREVAVAAEQASERREAADRLEGQIEARLGAGETWEGLLDGAAPQRQAEIDGAVRALAPGDVVRLGEAVGVVLTVAQRGEFSRLTYVDGAGEAHGLRSSVLDRPPHLLGRIELPEPYAPHDRGFARACAQRLNELLGDEAAAAGGSPRSVRRGLLRRARRIKALRAEADELEAQADRGTESLVHRFDEIVGVLRAWGYVEDWGLTAKGEQLAGIYHECDLLVAEALARGLLDGLDGPDMAGVLSTVIYEHRGADAPPEPWYPTRRLRERVEAFQALAEELTALEAGEGVPITRAPDPTFVAMAQAWAAGDSLDDVLGNQTLSGGDFVRIIRQLLDLAGQVARVATDPSTVTAARSAAEGLRRGVVAASSMEPVETSNDTAPGGQNDEPDAAAP